MSMKRFIFGLSLAYLALIAVFVLMRAFQIYTNDVADLYPLLNLSEADSWLAVRTLAARHVAYSFIILIGVITRNKWSLLLGMAVIVLVGIQDGLVSMNNPFLAPGEGINHALSEAVLWGLVIPVMIWIGLVPTNEKGKVQL
jgi:hypothetical protein